MYTDNWYTRPEITVNLNAHCITVCGTVGGGYFSSFANIRYGEIHHKMFIKTLSLKLKYKCDEHFVITFLREWLVYSGKVNLRINWIIMKQYFVVDYTIIMCVIGHKIRHWVFQVVEIYFVFLFEFLILKSYNLCMQHVDISPSFYEM